MENSNRKSGSTHRGIPPIGTLLANIIVPVLLSTAVLSAITYIYTNTSPAAVAFFVFFSFAFSALTFGLFECFRGIGKAWLTTIIVILYLMMCLMGYVNNVDSFASFTQWFMEPSVYTSVFADRTTAVLLLLGGVLVPCLYYFTRVQYRGLFVFLICMCPFCLFAKTFTTIPVLFPIIIMTLFFILMANSTIMKGETSAVRTGAGGRRLAVGAFVLVVTIIAAFMPKLEFAPYREMFDEFVTGVTISAAQAAADFNTFNDSSADSTSNDESTVVVLIRGDNPGLIKRQSFNYYDGSGHVWTYLLVDENNGYSNWEEYTAFEDPTPLYEAAGYHGGEPVHNDCIVSPVSGNVRAIYTPENMTYIGSYQSNAKVYRTENDEYFISHKDSSEVKSYRIDWTNFRIENEFTKIFTDEFAESIAKDSEEAASYLAAKKQAVDFYGKDFYADSLIGAYSSAGAHLQIKALAEQITEGCETDYEKASAIEAFFLKGDYIYDRNYTSYDVSPDIFMLATKRGACAAYATAMTMMCREVGLTVRYCEGFWVQRNYPDRMWYATTADSHSFVQVWLDGYGWTNFNPTSSVTDGGYVDPTFMIVGITAAVIAAIGLLILILKPIVKEKRFVAKVAKARGAEQASLIYGKINRMTNAYMSRRTNTMTPTETADKCAELFGCHIDGFIEQYERAVYGRVTDAGDRSTVYTAFVKAYKDRKKKDKKSRKKRK